ncbi:MAG: DUF2062 domain-containing protein [Tepidimonas ignava]|uniref:DUF2062 domain-containing protein n=1 Tax=Tepidimonas ignava TaxID=114249 RepID=UPI00391D5CC7
MLKQRLIALLPSPEHIHRNRWLRWLGPWLHHPRLWRFSRRGLALGVALGIFFGLLIPVAQIPASATLAVLLRAHLPSAMASTLVTNPVTFGPVYWAAYQLGHAIVGDTDAGAAPPATPAASQDAVATDADDSPSWWAWIVGVGKPLVVGLLIVATASAAAAYVAVHLLWTFKVRRARRQRLRRRHGGVPPVGTG